MDTRCCPHDSEKERRMKPGDVTKTWGGYSVTMYLMYPTRDIVSGVPRIEVREKDDGMLLVVAVVNKICYVISSVTMKAGWVYSDDITAHDIS